MPKPPGSSVQNHSRAPHPLHLSACLRKASFKRAGCRLVSKKGTGVNINVTMVFGAYMAVDGKPVGSVSDSIAASMAYGPVLPNLRWNAFRIGIGLLLLAANPWSGLTRSASQAIAWQPGDPFGLPRWWPFSPTAERKLLHLDHLRLMRSALRLPDARAHDLCPKKPLSRSTHDDLVQAKDS